ncbi:MAG: glycosyltransferase family 2 protein [Chloroflexi bacterium]|nr:glycosyltransferase family 2 protein [Chloroflexota bacterium]
MISIIIPCRNEARYIGQILDALRDQDFTDFEVIVVDGDSDDETANIVQQYSAQQQPLRLKLIRNPQRSIPTSLNLGIKNARGEIIVRLDGHSLPAKNYLSQCLKALNASGAEVVGGAWDVKAGDDTVIAAAIAAAVSSPLGAGDAAYRLNQNQAREVDTVPFGCFRRETWERVGGYNEELFANEDYEFYFRLRQRGGRIFFDPEIRCEYFAVLTLRALAQQYWRYGWWKAQMLRRHARSIRARQLIPIAWSALSLIALIIPPLWIVWGIYLTVVLIESWRRAREARHILPLACAYVIIHLTWGWGAWVGWMRRATR